jgi:hypothetical protein
VGISCAAGTACADGSCLDTICQGVVCAPGAVCSDGHCVNARCVGVVCQHGTLCAEGRCVAAAQDAGVPGADAALPGPDASSAGPDASVPVCPMDGGVDHEWINWAPDAPAAYTAHTNTVVDNVTGLTWQRYVVLTQSYTWDEAKAYCASLGPLDGLTGWRLPTLIELQSIVDFSKTNPSIDANAFPNTLSGTITGFWSSSRSADNSGFAWLISFAFGYSQQYYTVYSIRVRCVR